MHWLIVVSAAPGGKKSRSLAPQQGMAAPSCVRRWWLPDGGWRERGGGVLYFLLLILSLCFSGFTFLLFSLPLSYKIIFFIYYIWIYVYVLLTSAAICSDNKDTTLKGEWMMVKKTWWTWCFRCLNSCDPRSVAYPETQKMSPWLTCEQWLTNELHTMKYTSMTSGPYGIF